MASPSTEKRTRKVKGRKFFVMGMNYQIQTAAGLEMENLALLGGPRKLLIAPRERGFPEYPEPPRLLVDKSLGRAPNDWELFHDYKIVSERMKTVLETFDKDGVAFVKCDTHDRRGNPARASWLCDVLRILDVVDEEKSRVKIEYQSPSHKVYCMMGRTNFILKEEVVGAARIFRMRFSFPTIICDQLIKDACKEAGMKGISFRDVADY